MPALRSEMAQHRHRKLTADMISTPTNFVHFDGPSFAGQRVVDLEEARCRSLFDRLQKTAARKTFFLRHAAPTECGFLTSLRFCPVIRQPISNVRDISAPFNFVHLSHASFSDFDRDVLDEGNEPSAVASH